MIDDADPLNFYGGEDQVGKVKVRCWRGPDAIEVPLIDEAGVGWTVAEQWWPYQRPSFVTPPFAGYVSGHRHVFTRRSRGPRIVDGFRVLAWRIWPSGQRR